MKVLIVDDSLIVTARLMVVLGELPGVEICGEAQNALNAYHLIETMRPDVVLIDNQMSGEEGIKVLQLAKQFNPAPKVIMFTNFPNLEFMKQFGATEEGYFFDDSVDIEKVVDKLEVLCSK